MLGDLLFADAEGVGLFLFVLFQFFQVGLVGLADDLFQGLDDLFVADLLGLHCDLAAFYAAHGFDNDLVVERKRILRGFKIVNLAHFLEADADYDCHVFKFLSVG